MDNRPGTLRLLPLGQALGFDQVELDGVVGLGFAGLGQAGFGLVGTAAVQEDVHLAHLRWQVVVAGADLGVFDQRAFLVAAIFVDVAKVEVGGVEVAAAVHQFFQIDLGFVPGFALQADQRQGVAQVVVIRELLDQPGELGFGLIQAALLHQHAGVGQAQTFVVRVLLDGFLQQRQGLVVALERLQQAGAEQDRSDFRVIGGHPFEQLEGFFGTAILLQQHGLAEQKLAVVGVLGQQAVETLQQAGAGVRIGFGRGKGKEIEMGVALALKHLLHKGHGFVIAAGASQLHGGGALGIEVVGRVLRPDQCGIQGGLVGTQVFGDAEGALGHGRVLGRVGLLHIVAEGDVEAVALSGQFSGEQGVEGFAVERTVDLGLGGRGGLVAFLDRRGAVRGLVGQALTAAEEQQGGQQREGSIHRREGD
ncbi:hypothetical protein D9M71_264460 [compost metagenome]